MIIDTDERQQAIDPECSFIVQAPAGSGKTELLIQRLLTLLTRVQQPEAIVAITFTRKAAAEMQQRIIDTLQQAQNLSQTIDTLEQPLKQRLQLAQQVLHQDQRLGWHLLTNHQRLRIQTIDSLCHYLVSRLPITAHFGAPMAISDQPESLYQQAIQSFITHYLDTGHPQALGNLFQHLNHQFEYIENLLIQALSQRDQWLTHTHRGEYSSQLRQYLETALQNIIHNHLDELDELCQYHQLKPTLLYIMQQASSNHTHPNVQAWYQQSHFPDSHSNNLKLWQGLAEIFFKKDNNLRSKITKREGFPKGAAGKETVEKLIEYLDSQDHLASLIKALKTIPEPHYRTENWQLLNQLLTQILPQAAAHLQLIFQKEQAVDFSEIALQALNALGEPDQASDLLMALDYQIEHILVDEFQDTSYLQLQLLQKLTTDWEQTPHKTLFLVGDPMQSIYRFRKAEVNIFLQLWQNQQFNDIKLIPLQLKSNFRSSLQIVEWLNHSIETIFPNVININTGAVPGVKAQAIHDAHPNSNIELKLDHNDAEHEAQTIVQQIEQWQSQHPDWSIALLVKKRSQLSAIIPELQSAGIDYQSQDLLPLTDIPITQDLIALTRALLYFDDRTAWLACLRAPWCGLSKQDLTVIAQNTQTTIWQNLQNPEYWQALTTAGQKRVNHWCQAVDYALNHHGRLSIVEWIENTWQYLNGPSCIRNIYEQQASQQFINCLSLACQQQQFSWDQFQPLLEGQYLKAPQSNTAQLTIMTIHKSKGLEFDAVIVPSLQSPLRAPETSLFLWSDYYLNDQPYSLLAPIKRADQKSQDQPLYYFIQKLEQQRLNEENKRLLYVALTRTKSALYLTAYQTSQSSNNSFMSYLGWEQQPEENHSHSSKEENIVMQQPLQRLKNSLLYDTSEYSMQLATNHYHWHSPFFRLRGTLIHFILQIISEDWQQQTSIHQLEPKEQIKQLFNNRYQLWLQQSRQLGIYQNPLDMVQQCQMIINDVACDPIGQWLLAPKQWSCNEMSLTQTDQTSSIQHHRPDRVFQAQDEYWVIDYKTLAEDSQPIDLQTLWQQYKPQLAHYQALLRQLYQCPVHQGIYLPITQTWLYEYDHSPIKLKE